MAGSPKHRCAVCRQPMSVAILLDGFTTHPTCDAGWKPGREKFAQIDPRSTLGIIPCSQAHEAQLILGDLAEVETCLACAPKLYRI